MNKYEKYSMELFDNGFNCCQSTLMPYCADLGMDLKNASNLSASFGGGIGGLKQVCGAVIGIFMVMGLKYADPKLMASKQDYIEYKEFLQSLSSKFKQEHGSIICADLIKDISDENKHNHCRKYVLYALNLIEETFKAKA